MKKIFACILPTLAIFTVCEAKVPNCANVATTQLVKDIYWESVANQLTTAKRDGETLKRALPQNIDAFKKIVSLELSTIQESSNKTKDNFKCKANVTLSVSNKGRELMTFMEAGGDASDAALMAVLLGTGKDYSQNPLQAIKKA